LKIRFVGGNDGRVFAVNPGVRELGTFEWGKPPKSIKLCKALLTETMDQYLATTFYMRFMHRTTGWWKDGEPWTCTSDQILAVVDDIERASKTAGPLLAGANLERGVITPEPQLPGAIGIGENDTAPDRRK
jgi:hypothetical protein